MERHGTIELPLTERAFKASRQTRGILSQSRAFHPAARLHDILSPIVGLVGQRMLWGIVNLARRHPHRFIDAACAGTIEQGVHSYRHVKALTERLVANALPAL